MVRKAKEVEAPQEEVKELDPVLAKYAEQNRNPEKVAAKLAANK